MESKKGKTTERHPKIRSSSRRRLKHLITLLSAVALMGLVFWLLWNMVGVPLLAIPPLTYLQALGAMLLTGLLLRISRFTEGRRHGYHAYCLSHAGCPPSRCPTDGEVRDIYW